MALNTHCEKFRDELLKPKKISSELKAHVQECSECRNVREIIPVIQDHGSWYSGKKYENLKGKILQDYDQIFQQPASTASHPWAITSLLSQFFNVKSAFGSLAFAGCLLFLVFQFTGKPSVIQKKIYYQCSMGGNTQQIPLNQPLEINDGYALVVAPDGSRLEAEGKTFLRVGERGFELSFGKITATVKPSSQNFKAVTPHGQIEVLGTIFSCIVNENNSLVTVVSGKVKVTPNGQLSRTLVAGGTIDMVSSTGSKELAPRSPVLRNGSGALYPNDEK
ncbi:MAG: FecR domain-containing protein [Candidatus Riflebacteria bacterium]|nr:FecR domain-containing protein [Candidatus Riflebacteria bacterium]